MLNKLGKITSISQNQEGLDVPPGQFVTKKFPILTYGSVPTINLETWRFRIFGLVREEVSLNWHEFNELPKVELESEFHCVTQWSKLENTWEGVLLNDILQLVNPLDNANFAMIHCYGTYSTNLPMSVATDEDVLFAYKHDGEIISPDHGWPLRFVVPKRYGWKSAKWVNGLELMEHDKPGFWESRGYHNEGDPWKEERWWDSLT